MQAELLGGPRGKGGHGGNSKALQTGEICGRPDFRSAARSAPSAVFAPSLAPAQSGPVPVPRPGKAREAFAAAQQYYRQGDYETAAQFYQDADANKHQLTPAEQSDLVELLKTNATALTSSRDGASRLRQAAEALQQNRLQEASALLKAECSNQYLQSSDKAVLAQLTEELRMRGQGASAATTTKGPALTETGKEDYRTLVNLARSALDMGDLDNAEKYARQAEKKSGMFSSMPWNSHTKVLREVHTARAKQPGTQPASNSQQPVAQDAKQEQPSMLTMGVNKVKSWLSPAAAQAKAGDPGAPPLTSDKNVVAGPAATGPAQQTQQVVSKETLEARVLREEAIKAIQNDDLKAAKFYAEQAKAKAEPAAWWDRPTPDELLSSINSHLGAGPQPGAMPAFQGTPAQVDASNARTHLKDARALFAQGKYDEADRLCAQIAAVKVSWGLFEDNPNKLRGELKSGAPEIRQG